jgi:hypothetical protein
LSSPDNHPIITIKINAMENDPTNDQQQTIQQIYDYAAGLLAHQNRMSVVKAL